MAEFSNERSKKKKHSKNKMKGGRRSLAASAEEDFSDDDASSVASWSTSSTVGEDEEQEGAEPLADAILKLSQIMDDLLESRTTTRVHALGSLIKLLQLTVLTEALESKQETLMSGLMQSRKKGDQEAALAMDAIALMFIQLGDELQFAYSGVADACVATIRDPTKAATVTMKAVELVAICTFICGDDATDAPKVMDVFEQHIHHPNHLGCACLYGWSLLATRLPHAQLEARAATHLPRLADSLEHSEGSTPFQHAAAHAMTLVDELAEHDHLGSHRERATAAMRHLATESNKSKSKKDLKEQKAAFRSYLAHMEQGDAPSQHIRLHHHAPLVIDSWAGACTMAAFRAYLQQGTQAHLLQNQLVRDIFDMGAAPVATGADGSAPRADKGDIRAQHSFNKKNRQQNIAKKRANKTQMLL